MAEQPALWNNYLEYVALSDVGLRRANNQDSYTVAMAGDELDWHQRGHVFVVADGMGAHAAGELASKLACDGIPHTYHKLSDRLPPEAIRQAIVEANNHIHGRGQANSDFQGMGTTSSVLVMLPQGALIGHVGDSRVYRVRGERIEQLTFDHSLVWEMMAAGRLPKGESASFVPKNIITRSLGPHPTVQIDLEGPFPVAPGDTFMLCSDGLSGQVKDEEIGAILRALEPQKAAQTLIDVGNLRGGPDNITVIVVRVQGPAAAQLSELAQAKGNQQSASVHPLTWVIMGVCILAAVGMMLLDQVFPALISALFAVCAAAAGVLQKFGRESSSAGRWGGPLGSAPYTSTAAPFSDEVIGELAQLTNKLRDVATEHKWNVGWDEFNGILNRATAATEAHDERQAVREYSGAIGFMMAEIRSQRAKKSIDASSLFEI